MSKFRIEQPCQPSRRLESTIAEPDDMIRRAWERARKASPFRPSDRPATALLTVCDDGRADGEKFRLRDDRFVIGRTEGDLRIPHDARVSSRHVEIVRRRTAEGVRWVVADLGSRNGLFVRVTRARLTDGAEFLAGRGRYQFALKTDRAPFLEERGGRRVVLTDGECWIGSDPSCAVWRRDDPFCEPFHARVWRNSRGGWRVEHAQTFNGLWLRLASVAVDRVVHFQIGEQRFRLSV